MSRAGGFWFLIFYLVGMVSFGNAAKYSGCELSFFGLWWDTVRWPAIVAHQSAYEFYGMPEKVKTYECDIKHQGEQNE